MTISRSVILRMRNVSDKFIEKIKTHILHSITFPENRAIYEIMWKNVAGPDRSHDNKIRRAHFAY